MTTVEPVWPALAINYTTKTQFLFRINKGDLEVYQHDKINEFVPKNERPVPFENMIFIGDGSTDVPCFRLIREQGGHSIAVHSEMESDARAKTLQEQGRVNFTATADYRYGSKLDLLVKAIVDKLVCQQQLQQLR